MMKGSFFFNGNISRDSYLKILVVVLIMIFAMLVVFVGLIYFIFSHNYEEVESLSENESNGSFSIAPLPEDIKYTTGEILSKGASEGLDFCNSLEGDDKKMCVESYIFSRAKKDLDTATCDESEDLVFIRNCQYGSIIPVVVKKYCEESGNQINVSVIPSNIELCERIDNTQDREECRNPIEVLNNSDVGETYSNNKCEGYIELY